MARNPDASSQAPAFASAPDVPHLTGLRAIAAFMVLLLHLDQNHGNMLAKYAAPIGQGALGVDIFFVLSGYILSHVYAQSAAPMEFRAHLLFLWRRLARIYPVHVFVLAALFAMVAARHLLNTNFWIVSDLPRHLLLLQAWTDSLTWNLPAWSISAEWLAYVLFPVFIALILRPANVWMAATVVAALLIVPRALGLDHGIEFGFMGWPALFRVTGEFAMGVLGFRLMRKVEPSYLYDLLACCSFVACLTIPWALAKVVAIGIFVAAVAASGGIVRDVLASRPFIFLGTISYSIYMVHFPLAKLIQNFNYRFGFEEPPLATAFLLILGWSAVVTAFAAATYWAVERPARNWCRAWEPQLFGRTRPA